MIFLNYAKVKCRDSVKCGHASLEPVSPVKQTITANKTPYFNLISTWNWRWAHPKHLFQSSTAQNGSLPNKPATAGGLFVSHLSHRFTKSRIKKKTSKSQRKCRFLYQFSINLKYQSNSTVPSQTHSPLLPQRQKSNAPLPLSLVCQIWVWSGSSLQSQPVSYAPK